MSLRSWMGQRGLIYAAIALAIALTIAGLMVYLFPDEECPEGKAARFTPTGWVCD